MGTSTRDKDSVVFGKTALPIALFPDKLQLHQTGTLHQAPWWTRKPPLQPTFLQGGERKDDRLNRPLYCK